MSTTVAIAYDFDGTLAPGNMQEHVFLPKLGIDPPGFWERCNRLAEEQQGDRTLTYMHRMLEEARHADEPMHRQDWVEHGRGIRLFPGVEDWFARIDAAGAARGLTVKHYVISSGLREMIEGTSIRPCLDAVFASGFLYDGSGVAVGAAMAVNYTTKTQFLFRINKGAMDLADDRAVNAFQPPEQRVVPFPNMVFIGDGDTDIPCFRLVKEQGGHSIAVFPPDDPKRAANGRQLIKDGRVHCAVVADYSRGAELERRVLAVLDLVAARAVITGPFRRVSGYLVRHWRGALPLWVAFWINGALAAVLAQLAWWWAKPPLERALATASLAVLKGAVIGAMAAGILLLTWLFVGIWRAASAQLARGRISGWERSAQLTVLIGIFIAIDRYVDVLFGVMRLFAAE